MNRIAHAAFVKVGEDCGDSEQSNTFYLFTDFDLNVCRMFYNHNPHPKSELFDINHCESW